MPIKKHTAEEVAAIKAAASPVENELAALTAWTLEVSPNDIAVRNIVHEATGKTVELTISPEALARKPDWWLTIGERWQFGGDHDTLDPQTYHVFGPADRLVQSLQSKFAVPPYSASRIHLAREKTSRGPAPELHEAEALFAETLGLEGKDVLVWRSDDYPLFGPRVPAMCIKIAKEAIQAQHEQGYHFYQMVNVLRERGLDCGDGGSRGILVRNCPTPTALMNQLMSRVNVTEFTGPDKQASVAG